MFINIYQCYFYTIILVARISEYSSSNLSSNQPVDNFFRAIHSRLRYFLRGMWKTKAYGIPSAAFYIKNYAAPVIQLWEWICTTTNLYYSTQIEREKDAAENKQYPRFPFSHETLFRKSKRIFDNFITIHFAHLFNNEIIIHRWVFLYENLLKKLKVTRLCRNPAFSEVNN